MTHQTEINSEQFLNIQNAVAAFNPGVSIYDMTRMIEDDGEDIVWVDATDLINRRPVTFIVTSSLVVVEA